MYSVCIYTCTLLKVVSYYDLIVLSMSVMCFQKKVWIGGGGGWGGWGELYSLLFFKFLKKLQSPLHIHSHRSWVLVLHLYDCDPTLSMGPSVTSI